MKIAVIPARGGSKRIPHKNIKPFAGRPIISYAIKAAQKTRLFDRIIVSTDDVQIAEVAQKYGAEVPFIRDKNLSDDQTHVGPVIEDCCRWLIDNGCLPEFICTIFATVPLISEKDICNAFKLIEENPDVGNVSTISKFPSPVQRALTISKDGLLQMSEPDNFNKRSQDLQETYYYTGQFYWSRLESIVAKNMAANLLTLPYIISRSRSQDIDNIEDWEYAEILYKALQKQ